MFLLLLLSIVAPALSCTVVIVTKGASADGSNIVSHTDDAGGGTTDLRLIRVPPQTFPPGTKRPVYKLKTGYPRLVSDYRQGGIYAPNNKDSMKDQLYYHPLGYIDEVETTFGYWANHYGLVNDQGLAIGETTMDARTVGWALKDVPPHGKNLFSIVELTWVALERCATARCAIKTMGDLAFQYGFYSEDSLTPSYPGYTDSAESLGICDKQECWVFHVLTALDNEGAIWAAQRVPDGHVTAIPNCMLIREMNLSDPDNFMASSNVHQVAEDMGWWDPNTKFEFKAAYGFDNKDPKVQQTVNLYGGRRMWRIFDLVAPSLKLEPGLGMGNRVPTYPFSVKPDSKVSVQDVMAINRDYYQGTTWDLSKGPGAGPFGDPVRYDTPNHGIPGAWERSVYIFRNIHSHVIQVRDLPKEISTVMWYGQDNSLCTVYVPIYATQSYMPESYSNALESVFNPDSSWWIFNLVANYVHLRFNRMFPDVKAEQERLENMGLSMVGGIDERVMAIQIERLKASKDPSEGLIDLITKTTVTHAEYVTSAWWKLATKLFAKFHNGYITIGEDGTDDQEMPGYPEWWLWQTEFPKFPIGRLPQETNNGTYPFKNPAKPKISTPAGSIGPMFSLNSAKAAAEQVKMANQVGSHKKKEHVETTVHAWSAPVQTAIRTHQKAQQESNVQWTAMDQNAEQESNSKRTRQSAQHDSTRQDAQQATSTGRTEAAAILIGTSHDQPKQFGVEQDGNVLVPAPGISVTSVVMLCMVFSLLVGGTGLLVGYSMGERRHYKALL
eukprot:gb/GEZN01001703.1/.p1 GENE.gb/GEZN01001703.1/~~gb/GEZN01001703.1/.p1  ORF type:complete len:781 (-),score=82.26 gb/GEZN01001703.1/:455-2797(-)